MPIFAVPLLLAAVAPYPAPSPVRLKADVTTMVGFGTRHTASITTDPKRGIGAARNWAASRFQEIAATCGGCITVDRISRRFTGPRAPTGVVVEDVLGIQKGRDPNRVVIVGAHIDSRVTDVMNVTSDAPGANDNASGVALVLEAARLLSQRQFDATIVYAVFSGEEQGLWGAELLADTAKARGWQVSAMLNNDIVGNTVGQGGVRVADKVRVFSEGIRASEDLVAQQGRRAEGGEDDGPSRALAKAIDGIARDIPGGLDVMIDRRPDRFGRGGDHEPFLKLGYPAVRFSVAAENWDRQHQDLRTEKGVVYGDTIEGMDFPYLAKVTAINVATLSRIASAPAAPEDVSIAGALSRDTTVKWTAVPGAAGYRVRWRRNDAQSWAETRDVTGTGTILTQVPVDDNFVGVSALSATGAESLVSFAGRDRRPTR
ncbi:MULTISPECIES: M28 family metallopeptidase [unclassified Sphingomonas]|uniref:M20/M25/M40 family metallo-hydrolase n=1 Tax=unclassified Sphingomonas TaxID=196159 RepID=UPI000E7274DD|nr:MULTISPECIES: M28 family metallopeptidase [unclassified Sphingomonas]RKE53524.1 peptidase M28-like protein [Sphingomonas sp. PP-CC-1A-547]TCM10018.1 peptidase M28-like protein [Sphingomonas sp. PP-CC-3G-468]